jgi:hypothetical protein
VRKGDHTVLEIVESGRKVLWIDVVIESSKLGLDSFHPSPKVHHSHICTQPLTIQSPF